jgi:hypothetical protein
MCVVKSLALTFQNFYLVVVAAAPHRQDRNVAQRRMHSSAEAISLASLFPSANIYTPLHTRHWGIKEENWHVPPGLHTLPMNPSFFRTSGITY